MKKLIYTIFILSAFSILSASHVYAENEDSDSEIVTPDIVIDFDAERYWHGLKSGNTPYWKIEDGVGKFYLIPGLLSPGERQLESASLDLEKLLGERIGEDWVLRYKITIDEFEQGSENNKKFRRLLEPIHKLFSGNKKKKLEKTINKHE